MKFSDFDLSRDAEIFKHYSKPAVAKTLLTDMKSSAASTRWATSEMPGLTPFCKERDRSKWLKPGQVPKSDLPHYDHWLTEQVKVLGWVMTRGLYPTIEVKTKPKADQHEVILVRYSHLENLDLDVVKRYVFQGGGLMFVRRTTDSDQGEERYEWQNDKLLRSFQCHWGFQKEGTAVLKSLTREDYEYDAFGALERITSFHLNDDGSENVAAGKSLRFQKKSKTLTVSSLSKMIEEETYAALRQSGYF